MKLGGLNKAPRFTLRRQNGQLTTNGSESSFLGYSLDDNDGVWTKWDWDGASFALATDRYGIYPTYYFKEGSAFGVSTSITELLHAGASKELDDAALAVFLRIGFFLGEDTPFRQIRALPPGARITESAGEWRLKATPFSPIKDGIVPTRSIAIAEFGKRFQTAVDHLVPDDQNRVCLPLSGGRDSRHILLALLNGGNRPASCVTLKHFPPKSNEDARIAAELAAALGVPHVIIEPSRDPINAELKKNELTNFCADEHAWAVELGRYVHEGGFNVLYDGIAGDVLSAGLFLTPENLNLYRRGKLVELAELMLGHEEHLQKMLTPAAYHRWRRELAVEKLVTELSLYSAHPNPVGQFYFWNRTRREIALMFWSILGCEAHAFAPFLASPVFDLLASLPAEYFLDYSFHTEAIAGSYPEYAKLPYEIKDTNSARQNWADLAGWSKKIMGYCVLGARGNSVRKGFMLPRILKGLIDPSYGAHQLNLWTIPIYLEQLARLEQGLTRATEK